MKTTTKHTRKTRTNAYNIFLLVLSLVLAIGMTFTACEGPQGPAGPQGPQGPEGPIGPAGEDGSVIHAGEGAPPADLGKIGDYYLNLNNGDLYGPKNEEGWGTPITLRGPRGPRGPEGPRGPRGPQGPEGPRGPQGPAGEDGSQIYAGNGPPDASLGKVGDYYLDKTNYDLYGPKTDSGWGTPLNLKGTANVMYSSWITVQGNAWEQDTLLTFGLIEVALRVHTINANALSQDIVNQGIVNVYLDMRETTLDGKVQYVWILPKFFGDLQVSYEYQQQTIKIAYRSISTPEVDPGLLGLDSEYRYVLIPGGVALDSKFSRKEIKSMTYEEVRRNFPGKKITAFN